MKKYSKILAVSTLVPMALAIGLSVQKNVEVHAAQTSSSVINMTNQKPPKPTVDHIYDEIHTISGKGMPKSQIFISIDTANQSRTFVVKTDKKGKWSLDVPKNIELRKSTVVKVYQIGENGQYSDAVVATITSFSDDFWW